MVFFFQLYIDILTFLNFSRIALTSYHREISFACNNNISTSNRKFSEREGQKISAYFNYILCVYHFQRQVILHLIEFECHTHIFYPPTIFTCSLEKKEKQENIYMKARPYGMNFLLFFFCTT